MKARLLKGWPAALSALLMLAAFPPLNLGLLAFAALAPWFISLRGTSGWGAFRSGYLFGFLFQLGQLWFMQPLISGWTKSFAMGIGPWVLGSAGTALFFAMFAVLARQCWRLQAPWAIALVWAGIEVFRSYIPFLGFPFGLAATPLWQYAPIIQTAHYGTIYLVSAWVALANVVLALFLAKEPAAKLRTPLLVCFLIFSLSLVRYTVQPQGTKKVIIAGQLGVNLGFVEPGYQLKVQAAVESLFERAKIQGASLLVLPEGTAQSDGEIPPNLLFDYPRTGLPFVLGGQRGVKPRYQSAYAYDGRWQFADKTKLVIFGEYVPGRDWIPFLNSFNLPGGDLTPGDKVGTYDVGDIRVGPMLCFEGLFADLAIQHARNGAQLLAILSIDDWFMGTNAPEQLKAASVFRAIEAGVPLIRAASLGYTLAVDARGHILSEAPLREFFALRAELTIPDKPDLFPWIDVFPWVAIGSCVVVPVVAQWKQRRV
ncbi:MAG: apolipoprotein N-acyltransferase [Fimbriimonadaceae bacterium]